MNKFRDTTFFAICQSCSFESISSLISFLFKFSQASAIRHLRLFMTTEVEDQDHTQKINPIKTYPL